MKKTFSPKKSQIKTFCPENREIFRRSSEKIQFNEQNGLDQRFLNGEAQYELLDSGHELKLEKIGGAILIRPCLQAVWKPLLPSSLWDKADSIFTRENQQRWEKRHPLPTPWRARFEGITFTLDLTDFGHIGLFPEHGFLWRWMRKQIQQAQRPLKILNLFAYSGGATLVAAQEKAQVCHLDASKTAVAWARENAKINQLEKAPIRWIVDDALKFLKKEVRRQSFYDGIILDPPTFGRGTQGEVFKIERDILPLLELVRSLLSPQPSFVLFSSHTPGFTPLVLNHLLEQVFTSLPGAIQSGELTIEAKDSFTLPSGSFALWSREPFSAK